MFVAAEFGQIDLAGVVLLVLFCVPLIEDSSLELQVALICGFFLLGDHWFPLVDVVFKLGYNGGLGVFVAGFALEPGL